MHSMRTLILSDLCMHPFAFYTLFEEEWHQPPLCSIPCRTAN